MISPGILDLYADRWTAFVATLEFDGVNWTGATFLMQVRLLPDNPNSPLITLPTVSTASAEGVRIISVVAGVTTVGIRINETTMEAMPAATSLGDDATFFWDMHVTPAGGVKQRYLAGKFIVRAGVVQ